MEASPREGSSSGAFIMLTLVFVLPSAGPRVGLLRTTLKLVSFVTNPFRRIGMVMVFTVSFCSNARVPETAW
jgi:hypothetical protein